MDRAVVMEIREDCSIPPVHSHLGLPSSELSCPSFSVSLSMFANLHSQGSWPLVDQMAVFLEPRLTEISGIFI